MTKEEKARRYDEALEKARICHKDLMNLDGAVACMAKDFFEETFPELKDSEDDRIKKEIIDFILRKTDTYELRKKSNSWLTWIEKQGEQEPIMDIPKFKVGEWIIFNGLTLLVNKVIQGYYRTISKDGIYNSYDWAIDNAARLWTIADAKDGDVLVHSSFMFDDFIFIYNNTSLLQAYCYYYKQINKIVIEDRSHPCPWNMQEVTPATKEQRDALMGAITEAGHLWDSKNKRLIKV